MAIFYPDEADINTTISGAGAADKIYLPDITITSQIIIANDCQVEGQGNTIVDLRTQSIQHAVEITAPNPDVSNFDVFNKNTSGYTGIHVVNSAANICQIEAHCDVAFKIENCNGAEFESLIADGANTGFYIIDSQSNTFGICESKSCNIGFNLEGSSSVVGDTYAYQEFGLNVIATDASGLSDSTIYYFKVNGAEYNITTATNTTYNNVVTLMNSATGFSADFNTSFTNGDVRIIKLSAGTIDITAGTTGDDLLANLTGFTNVDIAIGFVSEADREDRTHLNIFNNCLSHENGIGIRYVNSNHNEWDNSKCFDNTNIGIQQLTNSYSNKFRGEIYSNINYGVRNTDRVGGLHNFDAKSVWWGDITGPSIGGPGDGDKISNYVDYEPWIRSGTEPDLTYPITRDWIWSMLGDPLVRVELTEQQVTDDITVAIEKFMYYWTPEPYYHYFDLGPQQQEILLPIEIPKESIIEVVYQPHSDLFAQLSGSGESFFLTYYMQHTGGTFLADFYIAMSYKETFERTLGLVPSWEFLTHPQNDAIPYDKVANPYRDFIRIYPKPSIGSVKLGIKVSRTLTEEEVDSKMWIRKYALTWAKEQLARVRGKFQSVPGPTGEIAMNAGELMGEAQQEREALVQDLIKRGEPLGFLTG